MEAKNAARDLYEQGWTQAAIAKLLHKSENTIGKWVKDGKWEESRSKAQLFKLTAMEQTQALIQHNLHILTMIAKKQASAVNEDLTPTELKALLIDKGETDSLTKLLSTVKGRELGWDQVVKIITELLDYISSQDSEIAKAMQGYANEYLNEKRMGI